MKNVMKKCDENCDEKCDEKVEEVIINVTEEEEGEEGEELNEIATFLEGIEHVAFTRCKGVIELGRGKNVVNSNVSSG